MAQHEIDTQKGVPMTTPAEIQFKEVDLDALADVSGKVAVFIGPDAKLEIGRAHV